MKKSHFPVCCLDRLPKSTHISNHNVQRTVSENSIKGDVKGVCFAKFHEQASFMHKQWSKTASNKYFDNQLYIKLIWENPSLRKRILKIKCYSKLTILTKPAMCAINHPIMLLKQTMFRTNIKKNFSFDLATHFLVQ